MNMRSAIKRSCDVYFYEVARRLGVDRLSETAKNFGLGKRVLRDFAEERSGVVPSTTWKKIHWPKLVSWGNSTLWYWSSYFQSTPIQLCLMTAQIANGGFEIKPRIIFDKEKNNLKEYLKFKNENPDQPLPQDLLVSNFDLKPLLKTKKISKLLKTLCILLQMSQEELPIGQG